MKTNILIKRSSKPGKKYDAVFDDGKVVSFGALGYSDYVTYDGRNEEEKDQQKRNYLLRHAENGEDWGGNGIRTAGWWSRWLLWNQRGLKNSVQDINKRFPNLYVIMKH